MCGVGWGVGVDEVGFGGVVDEFGAGACCADVGLYGVCCGGGVGGDADVVCLLVVGYAEEQAEVFFGESAVGVVESEAGDAGGEWLGEFLVGVVGFAVVDDVGDEVEGEW